MREIKFRAWDEALKRYFYDVTVYPNNIVAIQRHNIESMMLEAEYGATHCTELGKNAVIEQYTGLKDKNGKEIYEGDIVQMPLDLAIRKVGFVAFVNGRFLVKDYEFEDGSYHIVDFYDYNIPNRDFEVIGTIHENAELLGEEEE